MPVIAHRDDQLHIKLKVFVAMHPNLTIGTAVAEFIEFALETDLGELTETQKRKAKDYIKRLNG